MKAFQQNLKALEAADTQVLGVSMDSPFANKAFADRRESTRRVSGHDWSASRFDPGSPHCYDFSAGWSSLVARWAHNPKVGGSNPPPATNLKLHAISHLIRIVRASNELQFVPFSSHSVQLPVATPSTLPDWSRVNSRESSPQPCCSRHVFVPKWPGYILSSCFG